jgi:hypothetical protein
MVKDGVHAPPWLLAEQFPDASNHSIFPKTILRFALA